MFDVIDKYSLFYSPEAIVDMLVKFEIEVNGEASDEKITAIENYVFTDANLDGDMIFTALTDDFWPIGMVIVSCASCEYFDTRRVAQISNLYVKPSCRNTPYVLNGLMNKAMKYAQENSDVVQVQTEDEHIRDKYMSIFGFNQTKTIYQLEL